jgi:prevent-host-death family protein
MKFHHRMVEFQGSFATMLQRIPRQVGMHVLRASRQTRADLQRLSRVPNGVTKAINQLLLLKRGLSRRDRAPCALSGVGVLYRSSVHIVEARMDDINVTELRQNLPAYLDKVRRGQRIKVTSRGRVIAEIVPPTADKGETDAARARLRGSVLKYDRPLEPVFDSAEWEMNR